MYSPQYQQFKFGRRKLNRSSTLLINTYIYISVSTFQWVFQLWGRTYFRTTITWKNIFTFSYKSDYIHGQGKSKRYHLLKASLRHVFDMAPHKILATQRNSSLKDGLLHGWGTERMTASEESMKLKPESMASHLCGKQ